MMRTTIAVQGSAPVSRSTFWLMVSLLAWGLFQGIRAGAPVRAGSWALGPVDLIFLVLLPALAAFAFARLFLVLTQSVRGSLNVYSVISSPFAWLFWVGMAVGLIGHGIHIAGHALYRALPDMYIQGEFAAKAAFLDSQAGYLLLGGGFFLASAALLSVGQGAGHRISGGERVMFFLGSLATYGVAFIYLGVGGGLLIPAIAASVILSIIGFVMQSPYEITRDPVATLIMPGTFLAGVALIIWTIVVGGQPTWP